MNCEVDSSDGRGVPCIAARGSARTAARSHPMPHHHHPRRFLTLSFIPPKPRLVSMSQQAGAAAAKVVKDSSSTVTIIIVLVLLLVAGIGVSVPLTFSVAALLFNARTLLLFFSLFPLCTDLTHSVSRCRHPISNAVLCLHKVLADRVYREEEARHQEGQAHCRRGAKESAAQHSVKRPRSLIRCFVLEADP